MVSGFIGNEVPRKGLRVRFPCPPLRRKRRILFGFGVFLFLVFPFQEENVIGKLTVNLLP